jgi:TPP-dependent trihydroxycyclohexane-1,2-dione (THcHDO) dehydratase
MIRWKQAVDRFADWGLTFGNPDFVKYAESYGAKGSRVETADGLVPALEGAFEGEVCIWSLYRWTTPRTSESWSTSYASVCRQPRLPREQARACCSSSETQMMRFAGFD